MVGTRHRVGAKSAVIVCVCNNLNCRKVREAVDAGAASCAKVYLHHGVRPQCGRCIDTVREMVQTASADAGPAVLQGAPA
ncbi:(2Fe-2S)-binding protein [Algihabitans sp.]|uniref:(2Fe-2S)-binding protein n=1 Tax=Algihabitans sp. TaxID=2821514 RepID=UPI003BAAD75A